MSLSVTYHCRRSKCHYSSYYNISAISDIPLLTFLMSLSVTYHCRRSKCLYSSYSNISGISEIPLPSFQMSESLNKMWYCILFTWFLRKITFRNALNRGARSHIHSTRLLGKLPCFWDSVQYILYTEYSIYCTVYSVLYYILYSIYCTRLHKLFHNFLRHSWTDLVYMVYPQEVKTGVKLNWTRCRVQCWSALKISKLHSERSLVEIAVGPETAVKS